MLRRGALALLSLLVPLAACAGTGAPQTPGQASSSIQARPESDEVLGPLTRDQIERVTQGWVSAELAASPDPAGADTLLTVPPGSEIEVFFGTWCSDSRRELARLWRALDVAGGDLPAEVRYIGVDRTKTQPADLVRGHDIRFVPTFIVRRDGRELGRIVESAPHGIEKDLAALLRGEVRGVVSGRSDLGSGSSGS